MNTHKNARLTYARRLEIVQDITERGGTIAATAASHGVSAVTARKWLCRFLAAGPGGLLDKPSRPERSPRAIEPQVALTIVELRRKLCLQAQIASCMGVSMAAVTRPDREGDIDPVLVSLEPISEDLSSPPVQHG